MLPRSILVISVLLLSVQIFEAEQKAVVYEQGVLTNLKYDKDCSALYQGTNSCSYYVFYVVHVKDKTYEGECRDRLIHPCWDHYVINDPVEVRFDGHEMILKRPDGKEVKTTVVRITNAVEEKELTGTVTVRAAPNAADIFVDGTYVGNSPATVKLTPGKHKVEIKASGFKEWSKEITVLAGSELNLSGSLEKE